MSEIEELKARIEEYKKTIQGMDSREEVLEREIKHLKALLELNDKWMKLIKNFETKVIYE